MSLIPLLSLLKLMAFGTVTFLLTPDLDGCTLFFTPRAIRILLSHPRFVSSCRCGETRFRSPQPFCLPESRPSKIDPHILPPSALLQTTPLPANRQFR